MLRVFEQPINQNPQKPDSGGGDINEGSGGVSVLRDDEVDEGGGFDAQASNFQGRALRSLLWQLNSLMFSVNACDGIGEVIDMTTPRAFPPKRDLTRFVKWPKNVQIQRNKRILKQRLKVPLALNQFTTTLDKNLEIVKNLERLEKEENILPSPDIDGFMKLEQKQKYAVWKAAEIRKALKEGRKPTTGPPTGDDNLSVPNLNFLTMLD
ncbi:hypothetical protein JHK85_001669 [Glycine max]|nr:hypothetical protein JHK85_001669 [Glycine max]